MNQVVLLHHLTIQTDCFMHKVKDLLLQRCHQDRKMLAIFMKVYSITETLLNHHI